MGATREGPELLLVGGGHAHIEVLRQLILSRPDGLGVTLVSASPRHHYSGMAPGFIAGTYRESEISFDLPALCRRAGATFLEGVAVSIHPGRQFVLLRDRSRLYYDLVSFNLGSRTAGAGDPGVRGRVELVKPISRTAQLKSRLEALLAEPRQTPFALNVVGAGAAGVEVALALDAAAERASAPRRVSIVESGDRILPGYHPRLRAKAVAVLRARNVQALCGVRVERVEPDALRLADGGQIPSDLTVWATGPDAPGVFDQSDLAVSPDGYLLIDDGLRSVSDPRIFAAGDCATLINHPETPKAGVYAVRQAPVLWRNLTAALEGTTGPLYTPQRGFLSILNTGDGRALLFWKGFVSHSRWAWRLKNWIDRRFVRRYHKLI